jgi:CRP/FNR family cyclic AMP-dependent transcriptional regulator
MSEASPLDVLQRVFPTLPPPSARRLLARARVHQYPVGTTLCHEGATEDTMYLLVAGAADVYVQRAGERFYVTLFGVGEWFGEIGLILDRPRSGDVVCAEATTVIEIDRVVLTETIEAEPQLAMQLMRMLTLTLLDQQERLMTELARLRQTESPKPRLFISYSRRDETFVRRLHGDLLRHGVQAWLDVFYLTPGIQWAEEIDAALRTCTSMLVVLSPPAVASSGVTEEWTSFLGQGKTVVPILHMDCEIPAPLARLQYVDFVRLGYRMALTHVISVLNRMERSG